MRAYRISYRIASWIVHGCVWLTTVFLFAFWKKIPAEIPTHYNSAGVVDSWGGKGMLFLLVIFLFFIYGTHFIGMLFIKNSTTAEGLYSKKLKEFVTEEDMQIGIQLTMAYLAWTDASVLLMFVYIIFCSASCRAMGGWFIWVVFAVIILELVWYMAVLLRRKKLIRLRAMGERAVEDDREKKDDM